MSKEPKCNCTTNQFCDECAKSKGIDQSVLDVFAKSGAMTNDPKDAMNYTCLRKQSLSPDTGLIHKTLSFCGKEIASNFSSTWLPDVTCPKCKNVLSWESHQLLTAEMPEGVSELIESVKTELHKYAECIVGDSCMPTDAMEMYSESGRIKLLANNFSDKLLPYIQRLEMENKSAKQDLSAAKICWGAEMKIARELQSENERLSERIKLLEDGLKISRTVLTDYANNIIVSNTNTFVLISNIEKVLLTHPK